MRATTLIATLLVSGGIIAAGVSVLPAFAQSSAATTTPQDGWMSLQAVQTKLEAGGYRDFEKIEREKDKYEIKATDMQGQRVELDVDPRTGEILKTEIKRSK